MESIPCEKLVSLWNRFLETKIPCEGIEDFRIVVVICCVWGYRTYTSIGQHIFNTQTIWQLSAGDYKSIPALKIYILWNTTNSIPYLGPTQFQESIYPQTPSKNAAQMEKARGPWGLQRDAVYLG